MKIWQDRVMLLLTAIVGAGLAMLFFRSFGKWAFVIMIMPSIVIASAQIWRTRSQR